MKKRIISLITVVFVIVCLFCGCKNNSANNTGIDSSASVSATNLGEGKTTFVFAVVDAHGEQTVFSISTNKKIVGDALKEHNLISGEDGEFGLYVKTVNGITYDYNKDGKYWAFYINGDYATSGVDKTEIVSGNTYVLKAE